MVLSRSQLVERVGRDRAQKLTIAFANGAFDLLHVGHIRYLEGAKREADRLVVAINSDASVRALKGPNRPILSESDRAELVAALGAVDYVVIFDEPTTSLTPRETTKLFALINQLRNAGKAVIYISHIIGDV